MAVFNSIHRVNTWCSQNCDSWYNDVVCTSRKECEYDTRKEYEYRTRKEYEYDTKKENEYDSRKEYQDDTPKSDDDFHENLSCIRERIVCSDNSENGSETIDESNPNYDQVWYGMT